MGSSRIGGIVMGLVVTLLLAAGFATVTQSSARDRCAALTADTGGAGGSAASWRVELSGVDGWACVFRDVNGQVFARLNVGWPLPG